MAAMTEIVAVKIKIAFPLSDSVYSTNMVLDAVKFLCRCCDGWDARSRSGRRRAVSVAKMTGETERHS